MIEVELSVNEISETINALILVLANSEFETCIWFKDVQTALAKFLVELEKYEKEHLDLEE